MRIRVPMVAEPYGDTLRACCAELAIAHADGDTENDAFHTIDVPRRDRVRRCICWTN